MSSKSIDFLFPWTELHQFVWIRENHAPSTKHAVHWTPSYSKQSCNPKWTQSTLSTRGSWFYYQQTRSTFCKWVFRYKWLVAKGFKQEQGVNNDELFSPVVKMTTLRYLLAVAVAEVLELEHMDVKRAYGSSLRKSR